MDIDYNRYLNLEPGQLRGGLPINYNSETWRETEQFEGLPEFYRPAKPREDEYTLTIEIRDGRGRWLGNVEDRSKRMSLGRLRPMLQTLAVLLFLD